MHFGFFVFLTISINLDLVLCDFLFFKCSDNSLDSSSDKYSKYKIIVGKQEQKAEKDDEVKLRLEPFSFAFIKIEA